MCNLYTHRIWQGFVLTIILVLMLPACTSFKGMFGPEEDPKIAALQRETRQVSRSNTATQRAVKDLYNKLDTLDDKLLDIEEKLEDLADREPILITPGKITLPSNAEQKDQERITSEKIESPEKEKPPTTVPKKRGVVKEKRRSISSTKPTPEVEYNKAYKAYTSTRYDEALALFNELLKEHPTHHLADNAQYWIGEIYYDIENFPKAILSFKEVVTKYPQENKAADALLKIGYAYSALDDPSNARTFLKRVIKNYPFSDAEAKARAKLKELENLR